MPTKRTFPKLTGRAWTRPTPLKLQPPTMPLRMGLKLSPNRCPRPTGIVQSHCVLIAWRTLPVDVTMVRPKVKPSNAEPPSTAY